MGIFLELGHVLLDADILRLSRVDGRWAQQAAVSLNLSKVFEAELHAIELRY